MDTENQGKARQHTSTGDWAGVKFKVLKKLTHAVIGIMGDGVFFGGGVSASINETG